MGIKQGPSRGVSSEGPTVKWADNDSIGGPGVGVTDGGSEHRSGSGRCLPFPCNEAMAKPHLSSRSREPGLDWTRTTSFCRFFIEC